MLVGMNAIYEHPSLKMQVTPEQRDRAESWLKDAYADARITRIYGGTTEIMKELIGKSLGL